MIIFLEVTELGDIPQNHLVGGKKFCHHNYEFSIGVMYKYSELH